MTRIFVLMVCLVLFSCKEVSKEKTTSTTSSKETVKTVSKNPLIYPEEKYFKDIRQVTFGGDNAEAYWSFDDKQLIFQSNNTKWNVSCDQMFLMNIDETFKENMPPMVSTGKGRTTCSYFLPDNKHIIYSSTHLVDENCPEVPLRKNGKYIWPVYDSFDIFVADFQKEIKLYLPQHVVAIWNCTR